MDITYNTTIKNGVKQMLASRFFLLVRLFYLTETERKVVTVSNLGLRFNRVCCDLSWQMKQSFRNPCLFYSWSCVFVCTDFSPAYVVSVQ